MSILQNFVDYVETLPASEREHVDTLMMSVMNTMPDRFPLTLEQQAEIEKRLPLKPADIATDSDVTGFFAKYGIER